MSPILADPTGRITAGHCRRLAAKVLGLSEAPVITIEGLSEAQQRALRIADNEIALNAGWDIKLLKLEFAEARASIARYTDLYNRRRLIRGQPGSSWIKFFFLDQVFIASLLPIPAAA